MAEQLNEQAAVVSPVSVQEFSKKVKEKYPEYKDVDDNTLAQKIVEKYPEYKGRVQFDTSQPQATSPQQPSAPAPADTPRVPETQQEPTYIQKQLMDKGLLPKEGVPERYSPVNDPEWQKPVQPQNVVKPTLPDEQTEWIKEHPTLNAIFNLPGMGLIREGYIGTKKALGNLGTTLDFITSNISKGITGGMQVDEKGNITAPWEKDYKPEKSEFYQNVRKFENEVPVSSGGAEAFIGQLLPQTAALAATVLTRNPTMSKAYLASMYGTSFGNGIENYDDYIKETGKQENLTDRYLVGAGYGAAEYIGEKIGLDYFMPKGYGKIVAKALDASPDMAKEIGKNVLKNYAKVTKQPLTSILKKVAIGSQVEGGEEAATELMQAAIDKWITGQDVTGEQLRDRLLQSYGGGVLMGAGVAPFSHFSQNAATTERRRQQGSVTVSIDEKGLPVEIVQSNDKVFGIRPDGEEVGNVSKETIDKAQTFKTEDFEKAINQFKKTGSITTATIEGQQYTINNPEDLGVEGKPIFAKDANGNVTAVQNHKVQNPVTQTVEQIDQAKQQQADKAKLYEGIADQNAQYNIEHESEDGSLKVIDFTNGQTKVIFNGQEVVANDANEKDKILESIANEEKFPELKLNEQGHVAQPAQEKKVITQKFGNTPIDIIENEDYDEVVPSEKMPLDKALPILEKKFADNPRFEVQAERVQIEEPGETKYDDPVKKTVIKSIRIIPKTAQNNNISEQQHENVSENKAQSTEQQQIENIEQQESLKTNQLTNEESKKVDQQPIEINANEGKNTPQKEQGQGVSEGLEENVNENIQSVPPAVVESFTPGDSANPVVKENLSTEPEQDGQDSGQRPAEQNSVIINAGNYAIGLEKDNNGQWQNSDVGNSEYSLWRRPDSNTVYVYPNTGEIYYQVDENGNVSELSEKEFRVIDEQIAKLNETPTSKENLQAGHPEKVSFTYLDGSDHTGEVIGTAPDGKLRIKAEDGLIYRMPKDKVNETRLRVTEREESLINITDQAAKDIEGRSNLVKTLDKISTELGEPVNIINSDEIPEKVSEIKKQIKNGNRVPAFYLNGEVYILSDQIESVSDAVKSYVHETIIHKGLRNTFAQAEKTSIIGKQYAKLDDLFIDVFGSLSRSQKMDIANLYAPGLYENGKLMRNATNEEKSLIGEEFLAHVSENPEIYDAPVLSKWQEWVNRLAQIIRKAFRLTSNQFSQNDMLDIIREQRRRMGEQANQSFVENARLTSSQFTEQDLSDILRPKKDVSSEVRFKVSDNKEENNLIAVHNIKPAGLLNANRLGGLPMPSLAIVDVNNGFDKYGDITLIADKNFVDPKQNKSAKVFASDVYSARYPSLNYVIPESGNKRIIRRVNDLLPLSLSADIINRIKSSITEGGMRDLSRSDSAKLLFLAETKKPFEIKYNNSKFPDSTKQVFIDNGWKNLEYYEINDNQEVKQQLTDLYFQNQPDKDLRRYLVEDGILNSNIMRNFMRDVQNDIRDAGKVNLYETVRAADEYIRNNKLEDEFEAYAANLYDQIGVEEKIFRGYSNSGNRLYSPHTLENVLKKMKKDGIRGGEKFGYGAGSVRSHVTPEFKSLSDIQKNRGRIMPFEDDVKNAANDELIEVLDNLKKFYKYESGSFGYYDNASKELVQLARSGRSESFRPLDPESKQMVSDFLDKLANMPTEYFEAKINRGVSLAEFKNALIPENTSPEIKEILKFNGINAVEYKDNADRTEKLKELAEEKDLRFRILGETGASNLDKAEEATTRIDNLNVAREMEQAGKDVKYIRLATGWEKGVDGKWRYEVPDSNFSENYQDAETLEQAINNPELFKAYPQLKDIKIGALSAEEEKNSGSYNPSGVDDKPTIYAGGIDEANLKSVLAHEIQHAIQEIEGFAKGGSEQSIRPEMLQYPMMSKKAQERIDEYYKTDPDGIEIDKYIDQWLEENPNPTEEQFDENDKYIRKTWPSVNKLDRYVEVLKQQRNAPKSRAEAYKRLAGEVESRNVQSRMNMTPEERLNTLLSETEDVAREDQIVLMDGLGVNNLESVSLSKSKPMSEKEEQLPFTSYLKSNDVKTGQPVTLTYLKNTEKASYLGSRFGQDVEPSGFYFIQKEHDFPPSTGWIEGKITLNNPLVIPLTDENMIEYKRELSEKYKGKKKKALSNAIKADGYDGIITTKDGYLGEMIKFDFDPSEAISDKIEQQRSEVNTEPSEAQREYGNYKKGHVRFDGFDISIENPKGSVRSGVDKQGNEWSQVLPADYGYFRGTVGKDKDHVDVFIGPKPEASNIYVIDQIDPETGKFDEHKVMLGFDSRAKAKQTYLAAFEKGWGGLAQITKTDKQGLKEWFEKGDQKKPFSDNNTIKFRIIGQNFYSPTEKALEKIQQNKGSVEQFKAMLLKNGAKQAEMDWMGWDETFPDGKKSVTKADIQEWIDQNKIEVKEVEKGIIDTGEIDMSNFTSEAQEKYDELNEIAKKWEYWESEEGYGYELSDWKKEKIKEWEEEYGNYNNIFDAELPAIIEDLNSYEIEPIIKDDTKFSQYTEPGGENYKELLLTLPSEGKEQFKSSHYNETNILAHIRFNERTGESGERVLFVEEIQSDWAQKGKKEGFGIKTKQKTSAQINLDNYTLALNEKYGNEWDSETITETEYGELSRLNDIANESVNFDMDKTTGVPDMPFSKTDQWVNLAFRRMMLYAAENGFDRIAWTNGEMQAARYDLSKQVERIVIDEENGQYSVMAVPKGKQELENITTCTKENLADYVGKEIASKAIEDGGGDFRGNDLKIGGSGMKAFYDSIIPNAANKLGKAFEAKVENTKIDKLGTVQSLPVTKLMKQSVMYEGVPMFRIVPRDETMDQLQDELSQISRFRTASTNDALRSVNNTVETNMNESYGIRKKPFMTWLREKIEELKKSTRHFEHITEKEFPQVYDKLRQFEAIPDRVKREAFERISKFIRPIVKNEEHMKAFERYIVLSDLVHDIEETDLFTRKELPWGYNSIDEIKQDMRNVRGYVMRTPAVLSAIRERQAMMRDVKRQLVENKLLKDNGNNDYFHHQVLQFMDDRAAVGVSSKDVRNHKKGWQRSRQGSIALYNTNYVQSEFEVMAQSLEQLAIKELLGEINESINIMPQVVEKAKAEDGNWRDYIPEGYKFWYPKPGTNAYKAASMAEKAIQNILADPENPELQAILAEAEGSMWVIPEQVAKQLDSMKSPDKEMIYAQVLRGTTNKWKQWTLLNPFRAAKYNFNNMSGDLDIVLAYDPKILQKKYAHSAMKEALAEMKGNGMSDDMREALKYGVIGSGLSVQEIPDITDHALFKSITKGQGNFAKRAWGKTVGLYWSGVTAFTQFRENILRVAAYKFFKDQINAGNKPLGVSNHDAVQSLYASGVSTNEIAGKLARELMGDYGNISQGGQWIRAHSYPFWSWVEINAPRYYRLLQNTKFEENSGVIGRVAAVGAKKTAVNVGMLGVRAMLMMGLVVLWNRIMFPDEDDELQKMKDNKLKLIIGRREDGSIMTIKIQGAFSDVLSFFSLEDAAADIDELQKGKATIGDKAKESGSAFVNKFAQGAMPMTRATLELAMGKSLYPDVFNPKTIRDKGEHVMRLVSMDKMYNYLTHKPVRSFGKEVSSLLVYDNNPGEAAYYTMRENIYKFLKDQGEDSPSSEPTDRSNALYYYKKSLKMGDQEHAKFWFDKYIELGGTGKGYKTSMKKGILINAVPIKLRSKWVKSLDAEDKEVLGLANRWYMETYLKVRPVGQKK